MPKKVKEGVELHPFGQQSEALTGIIQSDIYEWLIETGKADEDMFEDIEPEPEGKPATKKTKNT